MKTPKKGKAYNSADLAEQAIHRRAVKAVIWGMPVVNYDLMRQEMLNKTKGKVNQIVYWGRPLDWHNQTLTPNPDTLYLMAFYNTKEAGPIVIEVPPGDENGSLNCNIVTRWQMPLEDAGLLGADKGSGGKYLIIPPGYDKSAPDGYVALQSDVYGGYALIRSNLKSHGAADVAKSVDYGKRVKVYPLSRAANPPENVFTDAQNVMFDSTIRSVTLYDRQTHALIKNVDRASRSSQIPELQKNTDGSIDLYIGPKAPKGKESNWIPTDPKRGFEAMFRAYAPTKALFEKKWVLPDIEKTNRDVSGGAAKQHK